MKVYLVTADVNDGSYGIDIKCLGIATNKDSLQMIIDKAKELMYKVEITEIETDTNVYEHLGDYYE